MGHGTDPHSSSGVTPGSDPQADFSDAAALGGRPSEKNVAALIPELSLYPEIVTTLRRAFETNATEVDLVITDLDNTLIPGTGSPPDVVNRGIEDARRLVQYLETHTGILVCVTGSSWRVDTQTTPSVSHRVASGEIPSFLHAIVTDGGMTALGKGGGSSFEADSHYESFLKQKKDRFPAEQIFDVCRYCSDQLNDPEFAAQVELEPVNFDAIQAVDPSSPRQRIYFQPHVHPNGAAEGPKVCLYFYANTLEERDTIEREFRRELSSYAIVCCEERDFNNKARALGLGESCPMKFCLDLTPVHKGTPVSYFADLVKKAAEALHQEQEGAPLRISVWYCGDAANDLVGMRRNEVENVVIVSGSSQELVRHADELATGGKRVYLEQDSTATGAGSILKALLR